MLYLIYCTCGLWFPLVEYKSSVLVQVCVLSVFSIYLCSICLLKYSSAASYCELQLGSVTDGQVADYEQEHESYTSKYEYH